MSIPDSTCRRLALSTGAWVLLALAGCERTPSATEAESRNPPPRAVETPVPTAPATVPDANEVPAGASYEVTIATGAANRKQALEECNSRPEPEREDCIAQVEADWEVTKAAVEDLRGEQQ